ncbi:transglutaminase TgpA family protein [Planctomycetes bacterium K23_9]|uniref:Protein-glutamine gamma-glutamyltransferase n=1 Tax=Stieleria marina TaxID=1930275 RepID=A0A517NSY0_9BACT|nr:Protein-glutamine gamma-glutamyltransferase [Planctomycetes bacterium K23_9]
MKNTSSQSKASRSNLHQAEFWLQFCFAVISCLGGLILASGPGAEAIPAIAISFSVFGFVLVDRLQLFHLPPIGAYVAMGLAAVYCVGNFWDAQTTGNEQMIAVAMLLVLVQAILMLQQKSPRIFEQIGVFCLLQLVVGAVFNDAIHFGLLLSVISVFAAWALSLMSSVAASEGIRSRAVSPQVALASQDVTPNQAPSSLEAPVMTLAPVMTEVSDLGLRHRLADHWMFRPIGNTVERVSWVVAWSPDSVPSLAGASSKLQVFGMCALTPAILLVTALFFYGLPRTTSASRLGSRGNALVGFSDTVRLDQFGQMLQSSATALRFTMTDRRTGSSYIPTSEIYLRGRVLENYEPDFSLSRPVSTWNAVPLGRISGSQRLPLEFTASQISDRQLYDGVDVNVSCNAMKQASLFAIAPYHVTGKSKKIVHAVDRWTLTRKDRNMIAYPAIDYGFGTNAFFQGQQSAVVTRTSTLGRMLSSTIAGQDSAALSTEVKAATKAGDRVIDLSYAARSRTYRPDSYLSDLTEFDDAAMPTLQRLAQDMLSSIPPSQRTTEVIAKAFERHLAVAGGYQYTLNLDSEVPPGTDPIEQFVAVDKRGHCQYFASALAMMLRAVNIPARLVVGYRTAEYNDLGQYFVARQLHAHAWVEALIDRDQLDESHRLFGQAPSSEYWLRLDPTPGDSEMPDRSGGNVDQVIDMAENLWDKYVVTMDADRQPDAVTGISQQSFFSALVQGASKSVMRLRRGQLGTGIRLGGWSSLPGVFSWPAAVMAVILGIGFIGLAKRLRSWLIRRKKQQKSNSEADKPSVAFYADALDELSRIGLHRQADETPDEFVSSALRHASGAELVAPLQVVTEAFYSACYNEGDALSLSRDEIDGEQKLSLAIEKLNSGVRSILDQPRPR